MKKVLVADDAHDLADSTAALLNLMGYQTRTVYNGREAVDAANQERPDVVLLDLDMPVLDGFGAAREIRDLYPSPPPLLVALSALSGPKLESRLRECGFDHYVTKPADIERLLALVDDGAAQLGSPLVSASSSGVPAAAGAPEKKQDSLSAPARQRVDPDVRAG